MVGVTQMELTGAEVVRSLEALLPVNEDGIWVR